MLKLKAILAAIVGTVIALFMAFRKGEKSATNEIKAESEEAAREYERAGSEALIGGLKREQEKTNEAIDTDKRDHFN